MKNLLLALTLLFSSICYAETYEKLDNSTIRVISENEIIITTRADVESVCAGHQQTLQNINERKTAKITQLSEAKEKTSSIALKELYDSRIIEKTEYFDNLIEDELIKEAYRQTILLKMTELGIE